MAMITTQNVLHHVTLMSQNVTHVIKIYRIREDRGGGGEELLKKKNRHYVKISRSATPLSNRDTPLR